MANLKNITPIPNRNIFFYYFYFMQERMKIFWKKCDGTNVELTKDPIFKFYKFTNVYRVCDRVSQYLIKNVIYKNTNIYTEKDVLLRILIFKIFNKINTWEFLEHEYGKITCSHFDVADISHLLSTRQMQVPIFNNAYMMTGSHKKYNYLNNKHEKWLQMVKSEFIGMSIVDKILEAKSLEEIYNLMKSCSLIGSFLAYQYTIDFNYSPYINFDENSFVKAGIGAVRGIKKCFIYPGNTYEDAIMYTYEHLDRYRREFGLEDFKSLPGRPPHLIDIQNCFCETDKYLRAKMPDLVVGNVRIKQHYIASPISINYEFPPKWNIRENLTSKCTRKHTTELTLF